MGSKLFIMEEKDLEEIVLEGLRIEAIEKDKAAERKSLTRKNGLKQEDAKYTQDSSGQTRDIVASHLNMSGKQWDRMKYIYRFRDKISEETYTNWCKGKISTSKLYNDIRHIMEYDREMEDVLKVLNDVMRSIYIHNKSDIYRNMKQEISYELRIIENDRAKNNVCTYFDKLNNDNNDLFLEIFDKIEKKPQDSDAALDIKIED